MFSVGFVLTVGMMSRKALRISSCIILVMQFSLCIIQYLVVGLRMNSLPQFVWDILLHQEVDLMDWAIIALVYDASSVPICLSPSSNLVLKLEYSDQPRSILWLLAPSLLTSPGHQLPKYWLCQMGEFFAATGKRSSTPSLFWEMYGHAHFVNDWPWISPWIKSVYKELDICVIHVGLRNALRNQLRRKHSEWDTESMGEYRLFIVICGFISWKKKIISAVATDCSCASSSVILVSISLHDQHIGNKQRITP